MRLWDFVLQVFVLLLLLLLMFDLNSSLLMQLLRGFGIVEVVLVFLFFEGRIALSHIGFSVMVWQKRVLELRLNQ